MSRPNSPPPRPATATSSSCDMCRPRPMSAMGTAEWARISHKRLGELLKHNYTEQVQAIRQQKAQDAADVENVIKDGQRFMYVKPYPAVVQRVYDDAVDHKLAIIDRLRAKHMQEKKHIVLSTEHMSESVHRLYYVGMRNQSAAIARAETKMAKLEMVPVRLNKSDMKDSVTKLYEHSIHHKKKKLEKSKERYTFVRGSAKSGASRDMIKSLTANEVENVVKRLYVKN